MTEAEEKPAAPVAPAGRPRFWFWVAGVFAVIAGFVAVAALARGTTVRSYVEQTYSRQQAADVGDERAYSSPNPPSAVTSNIVGQWKPVSQFADASGVYLRYNDDMVLVRPRGTGSVILVDDVERAYRNHYSSLGGNWGWSSGHGEAFRGRGPGAGK